MRFIKTMRTPRDKNDTFFYIQALCKDLERADIKKWLINILEILMAERSKDEKTSQNQKLEALIQKHEDLIPTVSKTQVKVDL